MQIVGRTIKSPQRTETVIGQGRIVSSPSRQYRLVELISIMFISVFVTYSSLSQYYLRPLQMWPLSLLLLLSSRKISRDSWQVWPGKSFSGPLPTVRAYCTVVIIISGTSAYRRPIYGRLASTKVVNWYNWRSDSDVGCSDVTSTLGSSRTLRLPFIFIVQCLLARCLFLVRMHSAEDGVSFFSLR